MKKKLNNAFKHITPNNINSILNECEHIKGKEIIMKEKTKENKI